MLSLRMSLLCALLAVLLLSGSVSAHKAKPVSSTGAPGSGVGSVSQVSKAVFSDPNDSFDCLALSINGVRTYAASGGGDIFYFTTGSPTVNLKPAYASGGDPSTANFVACQADEQGETLWLLDTRVRVTAAAPPPLPAASTAGLRTGLCPHFLCRCLCALCCVSGRLPVLVGLQDAVSGSAGAGHLP